VEQEKDLIYQCSDGAQYLLARQGWSKDTVRQTFSTLLFQQGRTLHSASLVHSPQNQDAMLEKDNNLLHTEYR